MGMVTRAKKRRLEEEEQRLDRISSLPDAILGDIVSLIPTKDGGRTQVISSRWRHLWRSSPLNVDIQDCPVGRRIPVVKISGILSSHLGPGRRFSVPSDRSASYLDGWLRSPTLNNLQELEFHHALPPPPLSASVHRFLSTLRVASFGGCGFPDGDSASALRLPLLRQLSLWDVRISQSSLHALLAGCHVLESLLLNDCNGCLRLQIVSPSLRSIGVHSGWKDLRLQQLIIEDAPCLERLLFFRGVEMVSVISAPRLEIMGQVCENFPRLQFGTTVFQGSRIVSLMMMVRSVKVLALSHMNLSLVRIIDFMKCFPCLDKLYIKMGEKNPWCHKYRNLMGTLDIRLKKIVLSNYRGSKSNVKFAKFFVLNARVLESMRLELEDVGNVSSAWIERQHRLLQIEKRASQGALFHFVSPIIRSGPLHLAHAKQVHDLSTADPFVRLHD